MYIQILETALRDSPSYMDVLKKVVTMENNRPDLLNEPSFSGITAASNIRSAAQWLKERSSELVKPLGLTLSQYNVLKVLIKDDKNPVSIHDIQESMLFKSSNVTRIIDRLLKKGLVIKEQCTFNRRKVCIEITPKGREQFYEVERAMQEFYSNLTAKLSRDEAETIARILNKLRA